MGLFCFCQYSYSLSAIMLLNSGLPPEADNAPTLHRSELDFSSHGALLLFRDKTQAIMPCHKDFRWVGSIWQVSFWCWAAWVWYFHFMTCIISKFSLIAPLQLEACTHSFIDQLREPNVLLPNRRLLSPVFYFKQEVSFRFNFFFFIC